MLMKINKFKREILKILDAFFYLIYQDVYQCFVNSKKMKKKLKKVINVVKKDFDIAIFFEKINYIKNLLYQDLEMTLQSDPAAYSKKEIVLAYPGLYAITTYRIAHELYLLDIPYIPRILSEIAHSKTGIDIHPGAQIAERFFIDHGTGIVIGETAIIGKNVKIYQGVTIGALSLSKGNQLKNVKRHPTIKNNVTIYSNASILGGDTIIGNNVTIGGNVFITSSIDDNTIVSLKGRDLSIKKKNN